MKSTYLSKLSIKKKIVIPILLIILLFSIISSFSIINTQIKRDIQSLKNKSSIVSEMLINASSDALWNLNLNTLKQQCEKVFKDNEVSFLQIKNTNGDNIANFKRDTVGNNDIVISKKILKGTDVLGHLNLTYSSYLSEKNIKSIIIKILIQMLAVFLVISFFITILIGKIMTPFYSLIEVFQDINKGDFRKRATITTEDEIGIFGSAFNGFIENLGMTISKTNSMSDTVAKNSTLLTSTMKKIIMNTAQENKEQDNRNIQVLKNAMNTMMQDITEQSVSTEETSAAVVEISETIKAVATNVLSIKKLSVKTDTDANQAVKIVKNTLERLRKVDEVVKNIETKAEKLDISSKKIGEILSVISEIAEQTNLLSLNAAIEAARAGEAGKGFAIVADEIQKLSSKTNDATNEIDGLVREIQNEVKEVVETSSIGYSEVNKSLALSETASDNLQHVLENIGKMGSEISTITNATEEQSITMNEIATSIEEIAEKSSAIQIMADKQSMGLDNIVISLEDLVSSSEEVTQISKNLDDIFKSFKVNDL